MRKGLGLVIATIALALPAGGAAPAFAASADFAVTVEGPADARIGGRATYVVTLANVGPERAAPKVRFTRGRGAKTTEEGAELKTFSQSPSQGTCENDAHGVICRLGAISAGGTASAEVVVKVFDEDRPALPLQATVQPEDEVGDADPNRDNDHVELDTPILDPISIDGLPEGCASKPFTVTVKTTVANMQKLKAILDGKVLDTSSAARMSVKVKPGELSHGSHKLAVVVQGGNGPPVASLTRKFKRC
jgi:hypothetical protein